MAKSKPVAWGEKPPDPPPPDPVGSPPAQDFDVPGPPADSGPPPGFGVPPGWGSAFGPGPAPDADPVPPADRGAPTGTGSQAGAGLPTGLGSPNGLVAQAGAGGPAGTGPAVSPQPQPPPPPLPSEHEGALSQDGARLLGGAGYVPAKVSTRKAAKAARKLESRHRHQLLLARRAELEAQRVERRQAHYLPKAGEAGPAMGRSYVPLRVTPHRATSEMLAGAYPFLAEEGLGAQGALIGQDAWSGTAFCYDPWELYRQGVLTNPNIFLAGQIGRGKSALAKSLASRYIAFGRRVYVPGDPKGEWTALTHTLGGSVIQLGIGQPARLNPLDPGPRPPGVPQQTWQAQLTQRRLNLLAALAESMLNRPLEPTERTALDAALDATCRSADTPILPQVVDHLHNPATSHAGSSTAQLAADGRQVAHALARLVRGDLAGLFDGPSTITFDPSLPILSLDLSHITGSDQLLGLVMACTSTWMEASLADPTAGHRLVVYDEAWRLLAQPSLLARMQAHWKLSRAWGLANLLILHRLSDLDAVGDTGTQVRGLAQGLLTDTATRILYNQPTNEAVGTGKLLGLSSTQTRQLPDLAQGEGLWKINQRAFIIRHICTPAELALYDTNTRMLHNSDGLTL